MFIGVLLGIAAGALWGLIYIAPLLLPQYNPVLVALGRFIAFGLVSLPFIIPAGYALTYKKIDRWGLLILGVATLICAIMIIRQVQTLGIPFGYVNV